MVAFATALLLGGRAWIGALRGRVDAGHHAVTLFAGLNVLYCSVIPNLIEAGENQRFKFTIEPLLWLFLGLAVTHPASRVAERWIASSRSRPRPIAWPLARHESL
jgi:hypothetical protein